MPMMHPDFIASCLALLVIHNNLLLQIFVHSTHIAMTTTTIDGRRIYGHEV